MVPSNTWESSNANACLLPPQVESAPASPPLADRLRRVFRLSDNQPLPHVDRQSLWHYFLYLRLHATTPFAASLCAEVEPLVFDNRILVIGLIDPTFENADVSEGLRCKAIVDGAATSPPLAALVPGGNDRTRQLVDDYWQWYWNHQA